MKRSELIRAIQKKGFLLQRNGGNHDIYTDGKKQIVVPRHKEVNELLAKKIMRQAGY